MSQILQLKYLKLLSYLLLIFVLTIQTLAILTQKPFWMDEIFILHILKYLPFSKVFGDIGWNQQFPRLYLYLYKSFTEFFEYSYLSVRILPYLCSLLNVIVVLKLKELLFPERDWKSSVLLCLYFAFFVTSFYFSQVKQYSMELLMCSLAVWQYFIFIDFFGQKSCQLNPALFFACILFLVGPFFSYNYPIAVSPIMLMFVAELLHKKSHHSLVYLLPIILFLGACITVYLIDIKYVLADQYMRNFWKDFLVDYSSLKTTLLSTVKAVIRMLKFPFFPKPEFKAAMPFVSMVTILCSASVALFTLIGLLAIIKDLIHASGRSFGRMIQESLPVKGVDRYFLWLFIISFMLFFMKSLTLGPPRLNCHAFFMMSYFFITGIQRSHQGLLTFSSAFLKLFFKGFLIIVFSITGFILPLHSNYSVFPGTAFSFNVAQYRLLGEVIRIAYREKAEIVILKGVLGSNPKLLLMAHHEYKYDHKIAFRIQTSFEEKCGQASNIILMDKKGHRLIKKCE